MRYFKPGDTVVCIKSNLEYIKGKKYKVILTNDSCYPSRELLMEENCAVILLATGQDRSSSWANHDYVYPCFKLIGKVNHLPDWF